MTLEKKDLRFVHYKWSQESDASYRPFAGSPSRRYFDPYNGHQVLFLINFYVSTVKSLTQLDSLLLESLIAHKLPVDLKSEKSVFDWLVLNTSSATDRLF